MERLINTYIYVFIWLIGPVSRVFANGPGDLGSIPGRVIPKTLKMVLDTSLLSTQQYKVCIKGKVEQSRERSSALPYTSLSKLFKREPSGDFWRQLPTLLTYLYVYISKYIYICIYIYRLGDTAWVIYSKVSAFVWLKKAWGCTQKAFPKWKQVTSTAITTHVYHVCFKVCKTAAGLKSYLRGHKGKVSIQMMLDDQEMTIISENETVIVHI